jgi:hypothetical protein
VTSSAVPGCRVLICGDGHSLAQLQADPRNDGKKINDRFAKYNVPQTAKLDRDSRAQLILISPRPHQNLNPMLPHEIPELFSYPNVRSFLERHVSMQLGDVREMLRLPLPALNMTHACNFAAAGTLCGFISGISISIYQPVTTTEMKKRNCIMQKAWVGTGYAFKQLLKDFYPWGSGQNRRNILSAAAAVYTYFRNPLAHALGVHDNGTCRIEVSRLALVDQHGVKQETGLTEEQIKELEQVTARPSWAGPGLTGSGNDWTLLIEGFYRDILEMLQNLARSSDQMKAAESRFQQGKLIWRSGEP